MKVIRSASSMQRLALAWRRHGVRAGLVPTMGCLHEGHLSLARVARRGVGPRGKVVVSIYVNPTQFGPGEDFAAYPRRERRDLRLCREAGVDVVFLPGDKAMYPGRAQGDYSTYVVEERLSRPMEGVSRPSHFRGVTTVVAKLFQLVQPEVAVFGAKDYQQAAVVKRMVRDLSFPVRIVIGPTVREADGLAMSSRNTYLKGSLRAQAAVLWQGIGLARAQVRRGSKGVAATLLRKRLRALIEQQPNARMDYVAFFDPERFETVSRVRRGHHLAMAVWVGRTRLIDNARL